eukprot:TRINITY_DN7102_c0_g4_i1.p1 TRINITY_DN7102_c0_g4~~TRINITY_DN7102_c0_g4_i1.p1  ORF type:complete len:697 (+),score=74.56 TRINITY_DN7102_c0_g4_i1:307-2397(+)
MLFMGILFLHRLLPIKVNFSILLFHLNTNFLFCVFLFFFLFRSSFRIASPEPKTLDVVHPSFYFSGFFCHLIIFQALPTIVTPYQNTAPTGELGYFQDRNEAASALLEVFLGNYQNAGSFTKQMFSFLYTFGLTGIGKTSIIRYALRIIRQMAEGLKSSTFKKSFITSVENAHSIYIDFSNGDAISNGELDQAKNVVGSRIFTHANEGTSWGLRSSNLPLSCYSPEKVFKSLYQSLRASSPGNHRIILFIAFDEVQYIIQKFRLQFPEKSEEEITKLMAGFFHDFTSAISTAMVLPELKEFNVCLIPIMAGTLDSKSVNKYIVLSKCLPVAIPLLLLSRGIPCSIAEHFLQNHPQKQLLQNNLIREIIENYGAVPRYLEQILKWIQDDEFVFLNETTFENKIQYLIFNKYSAETLVSAMGEYSKDILCLCLGGVRISKVGKSVDHFVRAALVSGCFQFQEDQIVLPFPFILALVAHLGVDVDLSKISIPVYWQHFEKLIPFIQSMRIQSETTIDYDTLIPGAVHSLPPIWGGMKITNKSLQYDENWVVLPVKGTNYYQFIPPIRNPGGDNTGIFLCKTANPVIDVRIHAKTNSGGEMIFLEQLRHQMTTTSETSISTEVIENNYKDADALQFDSKYHVKPIYVYITNKPLSANQDLKNLFVGGKNSRLAVITQNELKRFVPFSIRSLLYRISDFKS